MPISQNACNMKQYETINILSTRTWQLFKKSKIYINNHSDMYHKIITEIIISTKDQ